MNVHPVVRQAANRRYTKLLKVATQHKRAQKFKECATSKGRTENMKVLAV